MALRRRNGLAFVHTTFLTIFLILTLSSRTVISQEIGANAFRLVESTVEEDLVKAFEKENKDRKVSVAEFLEEATRNAALSSTTDVKIKGYSTGLRWIESEEEADQDWDPSGITLASDAFDSADERKQLGLEDAMIVSWWDTRNKTGNAPPTDSKKGVRVTFVANATKNDRESNGGLRVYKHALLVEPTALELDDGSQVASFKTMPEIKKPGIVWRDHWLYMIDSTNGIRVFDLNMMFEVDQGSGLGYIDDGKYEAYFHTHVILQTRKYTPDLPSDSDLDMAHVSFDRRIQEKPCILVGESHSKDQPKASSQLVCWAFDSSTNLLQTSSSSTATAIFALQHDIYRVTGAVYALGAYFFARSNGEDNIKTPADMFSWVVGENANLYEAALPSGIQNIAYESVKDELWVLGANPGNRYVVGLNRSRIDFLTKNEDPGFSYEDLDLDDLINKIEGGPSDSDSGGSPTSSSSPDSSNSIIEETPESTHGIGNVGVVAGGVVGGLAFAGIVVGIYICIRKARRASQARRAAATLDPNNPNFRPHPSDTSIYPLRRHSKTEIPSYKAELDITPANTFPIPPGTYPLRSNTSTITTSRSRSRSRSPVTTGDAEHHHQSQGASPIDPPLPAVHYRQQRLSVYYELPTGCNGGKELEA